MRLAGLLVLVMVGACGFQHGALEKDADTHLDAPADGDVDGNGAVDALPDADTSVCSAAGLICVNGVTEAITCNGACWVKCTLNSGLSVGVTETFASKSCTDWGGKLAPLRDANDDACVTTTLFPAQATWIGLEQDVNATGLTEGWSWNSDGIAVASPGYTDWDTGQPNDQNGGENGQEQCAYIGTSEHWQDTDCFGVFYRFSCQRPLQ